MEKYFIRKEHISNSDQEGKKAEVVSPDDIEKEIEKWEKKDYGPTILPYIIRAVAIESQDTEFAHGLKDKNKRISPEYQKRLEDLITQGQEKYKGLSLEAGVLIGKKLEHFNIRLFGFLTTLGIEDEEKEEIIKQIKQRQEDLQIKMPLDPISATYTHLKMGPLANGSYNAYSHSLTIPLGSLFASYSHIDSSVKLEEVLNDHEFTNSFDHEVLHGSSAISFWHRADTEEIGSPARVGLSVANPEEKNIKLVLLNEAVTQLLTDKAKEDVLNLNLPKTLRAYNKEYEVLKLILEKVSLKLFVTAYFIHGRLGALDRAVKDAFGYSLAAIDALMKEEKKSGYYDYEKTINALKSNNS